MRHTFMIVSAFVLAQGAALADSLPDVPPPPPDQPKVCPMPPELSECQTALDSCQRDVKDLIESDCDPAVRDRIAQKHDIKVAAPPPKKPAPPKPKKPHQPKNPAKTAKVEPGPTGPQGPEGKQGDPGKDGANAYVQMVRFASDPNCPASGARFTSWTDLDGDKALDKGETTDTVVSCDGRDGAPGKDGSSGRPGKNGDTRVQFGLGMRTSAIRSKDRPTGYSAAPEASLELWLAPTVEFVAAVAWAPGGDRNMVVTSQLRHRALGNRLGIGIGIQYQAWNLEGNQALWQSVLGMADVQLVLVETTHVDVSLEAGLLVGLDGYDSDAQFAIGGTGQLSAALKF